MNYEKEAAAWAAYGSTPSRIDGVQQKGIGSIGQSRYGSTTNGIGDNTTGYGGYVSASGQLMTRSTGSFMQIHNEVMNGTLEQWGTTEESESGLARIPRPHTNPVGQSDPIGDGLWPLLLYAALFALIKWVRRKKNRIQSAEAKR